METGCYVGGHEGWRGVLSVIELAASHGFKLYQYDRAKMASFDRGDNDYNTPEVIYDLADRAEAYLNSHVAEEGHSFGWYDGEFFYWSNDSWEEV